MIPKTFLPIVISIILIVTFFTLRLIRGKRTPRTVDILVALFLFGVSAFFLGLFQSIYEDLDQKTTTRAQFAVALLVVPLFTGSIGTTLITNALLADRDYAGSKSFLDCVVWLLSHIGYRLARVFLKPIYQRPGARAAFTRFALNIKWKVLRHRAAARKKRTDELKKQARLKARFR